MLFFIYCCYKIREVCFFFLSKLKYILQLKILLNFDSSCESVPYKYKQQHVSTGTKMFSVTMFIISQKWNQVIAIKRVSLSDVCFVWCCWLKKNKDEEAHLDALFLKRQIWTIFKVFTEFVTILFLCYVLAFWPQGMWDQGPNLQTLHWEAKS